MSIPKSWVVRDVGEDEAPSEMRVSEDSRFVVEDNAAWHIKQAMKATAPRQAMELVKAQRAREVEEFRMEQADLLERRLLKKAAQNIDEVWNWGEDFAARCNPKAAGYVGAMVEDYAARVAKMPGAAARLYLSRWYG